MPQIIVTADRATDTGEAPVMFRERVSARDFESPHFANQLVERLGWAVGDAHAAECEPPRELEPAPVHEPLPEPERSLSPVLPQA